MTIEKQVVLQLKIGRPKDGAAMADAARQAKDLDKSFEAAGKSGSKALSDASTAAKRFQMETEKSRGAVSTLMRELAKGNREAAGIDRLTLQLKAMGVEAGRARDAAGTLMKRLGDGARLAEGDVRRLAATLRSTSAAGASTAGAGGGGSFRGLLGAVGGLGFGAQAASMGFRGITQSYATSADEQINANLSPGMRGATGYRHGLPIIGQALEAVDSWRTSDAREAVVRSNRAVQRQYAETVRRRERQTLMTTDFNRRTDLERQGGREVGIAQIDAASQRFGASDRITSIMGDRRFETIGRQQNLEFEAVGRGEGIGRRSLAMLQREIGNRPAFGQQERFRIGMERQGTQSQLAAAQADLANAGAGGRDVEADRAAALARINTARQQLIELERRDVELTRQAGEAEQQRLERFRQFATQAEESYRRLAQAERDRMSAFREQFGLMNELDRAQTAQLAQRAAAQGGRGIQSLSGDELRQLQSTGLFDEQIRGEAGRRADLSGIQGIFQASGVQGRIDQAQARQAEAANIRVQLENQITNNITVSADTVAQQITQQLVPQMMQFFTTAVAQVAQQTQQAIAEAEERRRLQNFTPGAAA